MSRFYGSVCICHTLSVNNLTPQTSGIPVTDRRLQDRINRLDFDSALNPDSKLSSSRICNRPMWNRRQCHKCC